MKGSYQGRIQQSRHVLPAACVTGVLVWLAGTYVQKTSLAKVQPRPAPAPQTINKRLTETAPEEVLSWERTPVNIAEILRTDPRGSQRQDRATIWEFLRTGGGLHAEKEASWLLGADEALSWLRGAEQEASEIETGLAGLAMDTGRPIALREYALQHLGLWSEEHAAAIDVLTAFKHIVLTEQPSSLVGLALTVLCRSCFGPRETEWIQMQALRLALSSAAHPAARTAALQILVQTGEHEAEPIARSLFSKAATVQEKISALEILGKVGTTDTLSWLTAVCEDAEPLTASAQRNALEALRGRLRVAD